MDRRRDLQRRLETVVPHVYYEPSSNVKMEYPAIIYSLSRVETQQADNAHYQLHDRYMVTYITFVPWTPGKIHDFLESFGRYISYDRSYVVDNLHHYVFNLYY